VGRAGEKQIKQFPRQAHTAAKVRLNSAVTGLRTTEPC